MPPPALAARILVLAIAAVAGSIAGPGAAATPADDPRIEARARAIGKELRCLVCQNQSIDDSDAELAQDLRRLVRERVAAGDSDQAVIAYVVSRYGDFVRLKPPFKPATYALWLGPAAIAALATLVVIAYFRRRPVEDDAMLAPGEEEQLARLRQAGRDADRKT